MLKFKLGTLVGGDVDFAHGNDLPSELPTKSRFSRDYWLLIEDFHCVGYITYSVRFKYV